MVEVSSSHNDQPVRTHRNEEEDTWNHCWVGIALEDSGVQVP